MKAELRAGLPFCVAALLLTGCYSGIGAGNDGEGEDGDGSGPSSGDASESGESGDTGDDDDDTDTQCLDEGDAPNHLVRRLTVDEYFNTIQDVLGVDASDLAEELPEDIRSEGFSNTATAQIVSFGHVEGYHELGLTIVERLGDLDAFAGGYTSCIDFTAACQEELVRNLGLKLWRRPLSDNEVAGLVSVFGAVQDEGDGFGVGAGLVVRAMLQSPQFVYRLEDETPDAGEGTRDLDDYEMATRLSYLLWSSAPDDELYAAAAAGELQSGSNIEEQVRRMLLTPRARETSLRYVTDWLALDGLIGINRDPAIYPGFTPDLALDMREETRRVFEHLVWDEEAALTDLLGVQYTFATPELAALYGITDTQPGWTEYDLSSVDNRRGFITHAGVLALSGHGNRPSIVERGLFMLGTVLCASVQAPPANLDTSMSEIDPEASGRAKSEARLANDTCNSCHGQFDTLGWALEPFDGVGAWQTMDEFGNMLRDDGFFADPKTGEKIDYANVGEMVAIASESETARACVGVRKPMQFAIGRPLETADSCTAEEIEERMIEQGATYQELMVVIATHPNFRRIRIE